MSFGGHVYDMISRLKQNRALLSSKKTKFKKKYLDPTFSKIKNSKSKFRFKRNSIKELNYIKIKINNLLQKNYTKQTAIIMFLIIALLVFISLILN